MRALDAILFVLLLMGNLLALPIWAWLFGTPLVQLWRWSRARLAHLHRIRKRTPHPYHPLLHLPSYELNLIKRPLLAHPIAPRQPLSDMASHPRRLAERELSSLDDAP